ncbi:MAG: hypothetical protein JKX85_13840 [Phycisphaeraceae bacterium]|nr:hypothetical protein [Phycisphaeraceae bacterium]
MSDTLSVPQKLESVSQQIPMQGGSPTQSHTFINSPMIGKTLSGLFRTHPTTQDRVTKLRALVD